MGDAQQFPDIRRKPDSPGNSMVADYGLCCNNQSEYEEKV